MLFLGTVLHSVFLMFSSSSAQRPAAYKMQWQNFWRKVNVGLYWWRKVDLDLIVRASTPISVWETNRLSSSHIMSSWPCMAGDSDNILSNLAGRTLIHSVRTNDKGHALYRTPMGSQPISQARRVNTARTADNHQTVIRTGACCACACTRITQNT